MNVAGAPGGFSIQVILIHSPKIKPTNPGNKFYGSYEVTGKKNYSHANEEMWQKKTLQIVSGACRLFQILLELFQPWLFLGQNVWVKLSRCNVFLK